MSSGSSWLDDLEARLEQQLDAFLRANPEQEALLRDQQQQDQQRRERERRRQQLQRAEQLRRQLLELAAEIQQWQGRVQRAQQAGATDLSQRAEQHLAQLMEQGRAQWQELEELGRAAAAAQAGAAGAAAAPAEEPLERAWARFETEQELEELRRRQG